MSLIVPSNSVSFNRSAALLVERKHLFADHIRVRSNRTHEQLCLLEDRQTNFREAKRSEDFARSLLHAIPHRRFRRCDIAHTLDGLKFHWCRLSSAALSAL